MKYLLDEQELKALAPVAQVAERDLALEVARVAILKAADYTCIHDRGGDTHGRRWGAYCDDCPVSRIGMPAAQPGNRLDRDADRLICRRTRSYGK